MFINILAQEYVLLTVSLLLVNTIIITSFMQTLYSHFPNIVQNFVTELLWYTYRTGWTSSKEVDCEEEINLIVLQLVAFSFAPCVQMFVICICTSVFVNINFQSLITMWCMLCYRRYARRWVGVPPLWSCGTRYHTFRTALGTSSWEGCYVQMWYMWLHMPVEQRLL